jgi:CheY-like chemotaxis protein
MPWRILWLNNDPALVKAHMGGLSDAGHELEMAKTLTRAIELLAARPWDLLILDVMIPTMTDEEEVTFPPSETAYGLRTGLVFYRWLRGRRNLDGMRVLVLTVDPDRDAGLRSAFVAEGLPAACFATLMTLRDADDLVLKVEDMMAGR